MGEPICPKCKCRMRVDTSKRVGNTQFRYYECCGLRDSREVPRSEIFTRRPGQRVKKRG